MVGNSNNVALHAQTADANSNMKIENSVWDIIHRISGDAGQLFYLRYMNLAFKTGDVTLASQMIEEQMNSYAANSSWEERKGMVRGYNISAMSSATNDESQKVSTALISLDGSIWVLPLTLQ
ncbi:MAG: hypothetical protein Q8T09_01605 [Candidatus Melainabacteria bacterium]|nr:hypothetical protein [Candidatus Melainabacteria bacterium]